MIQEGFEDLELAGTMPSPASMGMRILRLAAEKPIDVAELVRCLRADPASALRVFKLARGADAQAAEGLATITAAAAVIGADALESAALAFTLVSANRPGYCKSFGYERHFLVSIASASAAHALAQSSGACDPEMAWTCGLFAHVGELALARVHPEEYARLVQQMRGGTLARALAAEREAFEIQRFEAAAALMTECGVDAACRAAVLALGAREEPEEESPLARVLRSAFDLTEQVARGFPAADARSNFEGKNENATWDRLGLDQSALEAIVSSAREQLAQTLAAIDPDAVLREQPPTTTISPATTAAEVPAPSPVRRLSVLVVDDDLMLLRSVLEPLRKAGYDVISATDGEAGLALAISAEPHIVITDWMMPKLSGIELCRALRRMESGRRTFVLMLTGRGGESDVVEAFGAGADDYLTKPFPSRVLLARVQAAERLVELQRVVETDRHERTERVEELGLLTRALEAASLTDALTELPNRRRALALLEAEWSAASRDDRPLALVLVDIDHFKRINDMHGHAVGDLVLKELARRLRSHTRRGDLVCRFGGEEFVVICPGSDAVGAWRCAARLRTVIEQRPVELRALDIAVTASFGIAVRSGAMRRVDELLKVADAGLRDAKGAGRNAIRGDLPPGALRDSA